MIAKHIPGAFYIDGRFIYSQSERDAHRAAIAADRKSGSMLQPVAAIIGRGDEQGQAIARLLAAAPELLSACSDWIEWLEPDTPWREDAAEREAGILDAMRAAIAKATGGQP